MDKNTVLDYFRDFSKINRCSKHEEKIADYLEKFAHDNDLECKRDKSNNIYIKSCLLYTSDAADDLLTV